MGEIFSFERTNGFGGSLVEMEYCRHNFTYESNLVTVTSVIHLKQPLKHIYFKSFQYHMVHCIFKSNKRKNKLSCIYVQFSLTDLVYIRCT